MLLNEFLKAHRKVMEQEETIKQLKAELRATAMRQQKQIDAISGSLQKVSAQLELSQSASQTVSNNSHVSKDKEVSPLASALGKESVSASATAGGKESVSAVAGLIAQQAMPARGKRHAFDRAR
jgi:hypothetical protein